MNCITRIPAHLFLAATMATIASGSHAAEIVRFYNLGEDDSGAAIGERATITVDSIDFPDDQGGAVVDLFGLGTYVEGRTEESPLAIAFDGDFDWFQSGPIGRFDPRDFGGSFTALSQGWIKPDSAGSGTLQTIWAVGNDLGGVSITEDGFWQLNSGGSAGSVASDTPVVFDEWAHLAVLRGGNNGTLYLNGSVIARNDGFWNGTDQFFLGSGLEGADPFFGVIDEFALSGFGDGSFDPAIDILFPIELSGVAGDVLQDGVVDAQDYDIWSQNIGFDNGLGVGDASTLLRGDVDQNGRINFFDFQIIRNEAGGNVAVPEPGSVTLLLIGLVAFEIWRRAKKLLPSACLLLVTLAASSGRADVIVADDFLYAQPTKAFGPGGGFTRQDYGGGQNGPAGSWLGQWVSVGDGIVTGNDISEETFNLETDTFQGATRNGLSVNWLERDFELNGLPNDQTLFFGITMRSNNEETLPSSTFFVNDPGGDNQIGLGLFEGGFRGVLGPQDEGDPRGIFPGPGITDGLDPQRLVGKLEMNANGNDERLTVWLNPTDVETAENSVSLEGDVITGLDELIGNLRLDHVGSGGITFWDDLALGTSWEAVAEVDVPRMTLQADPDTRVFRFTNTTGDTQDVVFVQAESEAGLADNFWTSLADQGEAGWQENTPTTNRLTESNFQGSLTMEDGDFFEWGTLFGRSRTEDVIAHVGTADGLLNLAEVIYAPIPVDDLVGDVDGDGDVDLADFTVLKDAFGTNEGDANYVAAADFDGNGNIGLADFTALKDNFGAVNNVPEPSCLVLLFAGLVSFLGRRFFRHAA